LEHRERQVDEAKVELGGAVRARESAEALHDRAERERRVAAEEAARVRAHEAERLDRGGVRVADLAQAGAWEVGARAAAEALTRAVATAARRVDEAQTTESSARTELARTMADRDVVAKDESRFDARMKKAALAAEEEAAEEAFRGGWKKAGQ
jgi:hypothetical protein